MRRSDAALRRTAIHEAGHAVAAIALGLECTEVSIVPDREEMTAGHCIYTADPWEILAAWWHRRGLHHRTERSAQRASAIVMLAGAMAEREVLGRAGPGAGDDRRRAGWLVDDMTDEDGDIAHTLRQLERAAKLIVRHHRLKIEALVEQVLHCKTMTGPQLTELWRPGNSM